MAGGGKAAFGRFVSGGVGRGDDYGLSIQVEGGSGDFVRDLEAAVEDEGDAQLKALEAAYWRAMDRVVVEGKTLLRADVASGGFHNGASLSKTWRGETYPKGGGTVDVAGWIYSRARTLIEAFDTGTVIRVTQGEFLAIPQGAAKQIVRDLQKRKKAGDIGRDAFGKFMKDDSYVIQVTRKLGLTALKPIISADGQRGVLVTGGLRPGGDKPIVLFALAKVARLKKRIQGRALLQQIERGFPAGFTHELAGELAAIGQDGE